MTNPVASIIIATRNRAEDLRETLASLGACRCPADLPTELLVVDNASTDHTAKVLQATHLTNLEFRPLHEPRPGKSRALNRALAAARGEVLLFTDDDVRVPPDWVQRIGAPILEGRAHGVCGGVRLAAHLRPEQLTEVEQGLMVSSEHTTAAELADPFLIGVNMAFAREVLETIGGYDIELGPGTKYAGEDVLFSLQFKRAGFKIRPLMDVIVEHHPDPQRITRDGMLVRPRWEGVGSAYIRHHWGHEEISLPRLRLLKHELELAWKQLTHLGRGTSSCPDWKIELARDIAFYQQYLIERNRPRNYPPFGMHRLDGQGVASYTQAAGAAEQIQAGHGAVRAGGGH